MEYVKVKLIGKQRSICLQKPKQANRRSATVDKEGEAVSSNAGVHHLIDVGMVQ